LIAEEYNYCFDVMSDDPIAFFYALSDSKKEIIGQEYLK
jgi:hypothetical protein